MEGPRVREIDISKPAQALRFIRFAEYVAVLGGLTMLYAFLSVMVANPDLRTGDRLILYLFMIAMVSVPVFVGYRGINRLDSRILRAYFITFPMLLIIMLFSLFSILILILAAMTQHDKSLLDEGHLIALIYLGPATVIICTGLVFDFLLIRMRVDSLGINLVRLLSNLKSQSGPQAKKVKRVNLNAGIWNSLLGGGLVLGGILLPLKSIEDLSLSILGYFVLIKARRYLQADIQSLLTLDKRRVILLLRAFDDDIPLPLSSFFLFPIKWVIDFSLEARLLNHFSYFGPFITVGSPKDPLPLPGAARAFLSDSDWPSQVIRWISEAALIIMYAGKTPWVSWELAKVIEAERVRNLIMIFPEIRHGSLYQDIYPRIECVRHVFQNTKWSEALASFQDYVYPRAILFRDDGSIIVIKSRYLNRDSYHLAAIIAHYLMLSGSTDAV
ncbi:MAG TPA: hypothetical protein VJ843_00040 [Candidatus Saccharimonadales bacterium]|nr:hypothetical protein [Candidatus Saccharimonadales bacterium]